MHVKSAISILFTGALLGSFAASPLSAATATASFAVTATVAAGCDVSSSLSAAQISASSNASGRGSTSMNCSLPVSYLVSVGDNSWLVNTTADAPSKSLSFAVANAQSSIASDRALSVAEARDSSTSTLAEPVRVTIVY